MSLFFCSFIETYVWKRFFHLQITMTTPDQLANIFLKARHGLFLKEVNWVNIPEIIPYLHFCFATSLIWAAMSYSDLPQIKVAIRNNTQCTIEHVKCNKYILLTSQYKTYVKAALCGIIFMIKVCFFWNMLC